MKALYKSGLMYLSDKEVPKKEDYNESSAKGIVIDVGYSEAMQTWLSQAKSYPCAEEEKEKFREYLFNLLKKDIWFEDIVEQGIEIDSERYEIKEAKEAHDPGFIQINMYSFFVPIPGKPAKLPESNGWISVGDRLPKHFANVLGLTNKGMTRITFIDRGTKKFDVMEINEEKGEHYTHWQECPPPPSSPAAEGNEVVEFAEWLGKTDWKFIQADKNKWGLYPSYDSKRGQCYEWKTTKQLYTLFKNSKG